MWSFHLVEILIVLIILWKDVSDGWNALYQSKSCASVAVNFEEKSE